MSKVICEREDLVAIADAVRSKTETTGELTLGEIVDNINSIGASDTIKTCTVTINMHAGTPVTYFNTTQVAITYINSDGNLVSSNDIVQSGSIFGSISTEFSITVTCRCGTPLTFMQGVAGTITYVASEEITQILHVEDEERIYSWTIMTPEQSGDYTIDYYGRSETS